jgi:hypothetical protein
MSAIAEKREVLTLEVPTADEGWSPQAWIVGAVMLAAAGILFAVFLSILGAAVFASFGGPH